ncbi:ABC transporter ATP-binding protein [Enterococcus mundtii 3F]|uniref:ABC transporter ATP-binding protein n=1 Tax=Enterococcus mundtii TaxID=53346 RepID=UPI00230347DE|nr:ABC transporter ATP-binding protein [Enterococcus mundtii]MDA9462078.1 ABC transporter ATP-binding protein [Enterococcus mundtii 3F]
MEQLLTLKHIRKQFKNKQAIEDINLQINRGEIIGFLGPSGAGKTTTIKIATGQLKQTSGESIILGKSNEKIDERIYENIGIVTDSSGIYEEFTVYDNLLLFANLLNVPVSKINKLLNRVGLFEQKKQLAGKLSKGQSQRLVLARAVLHNPQLLFLDEPTSGLDPSTALEIHKLLLELKENGMGIFLTTHNMVEASKLCDRVALLNDGVIVEYGSPEEICLRHNRNKRYEIHLANGKKFTLNHSKETSEKIQNWLVEDQIEAIHSCEPTLESVFLTVTGRELQ